MADVEFKGGDKLNAIFAKAGKGGISSVDIGVFASAKYPDGTPVAAVAAWNEFGTVTIPELPAIRIANKENEKTLINLIKKTVDPETMVITPRIGGLIGANHQGATQQSITRLSSPANAPSTIKAKKSSNPLIDKGTYRSSITFKVNQ